LNERRQRVGAQGPPTRDHTWWMLFAGLVALFAPFNWLALVFAATGPGWSCRSGRRGRSVRVRCRRRHCRSGGRDPSARRPSSLRGVSRTTSPGWLWLLPVPFAQTGIAEEEVFRGYLFGLLHRGRGFWRVAAGNYAVFPCASDPVGDVTTSSGAGCDGTAPNA
jgi:hypothetical protein